jgi:hemolysin activation/secretion protein
LDVKLENILAAGEQLSVFWKSDGNDQKTFNAQIEIPYLLKTPIGLKAQIQLFKQDSTFQNTKTAIDFSYFATYNTRFYLGYQSTESSDIQNSNNTSISDFNNSYITSSFEYTKLDSDNITFPIKSKFFTSVGIGKRDSNVVSENRENKQFFVNIQAMHNIYLNKKNSINLNSQNYYLRSNNYIINELFRFGGFKSLRGFTENSLQAYFTTSILTEYRYILSSNLYIHSILDYCIYKDKNGLEIIDKTQTLIGAGLGIGLQTKNGILKLAAANGTAQNQQFKISNSIIHISFNVKF